MSIKKMHYAFKSKLNKVDSQKNRNFQIPEIDVILNEAQRLFIKIVAQPRQDGSFRGFEKRQRSIDDIRALVVNPDIDPSALLNVTDNYAELPKDYWFYIKSKAIISKGCCKSKKAGLFIQQHDDEFENSDFYGSSFEWRHVNALFVKDSIKVFDDGTFTVDKIELSYVKQPVEMHNAEDFRQGFYRNLDGELLTGSQDSPLPPQTHDEIVDLAVMMASNQIELPSYRMKIDKLNFNELT